MQQQMWKVYAKGIVDYVGTHLDEEELNVMERVLQRMIAAASELLS